MADVLASNALVRLVVDDADPAGVPSRVDHVADDRSLVVAAPTFGGDLFVTTGREVTVVWADARGMYELATVLTEVVHARVPLWRLAPRAEPQLLQRRRFVRVRCHERLVLQPHSDSSGGADAELPNATGASVEADAHATGVLNGFAVDLSEGGVRALMPAAATRLEPGSSVSIELSLGPRTVVPSGTVLRVVPGERDQLEVVIRFDDPVDGEADIRRWVMQQQLLERRAARDS